MTNGMSELLAAQRRQCQARSCLGLVVATIGGRRSHSHFGHGYGCVSVVKSVWPRSLMRRKLQASESWHEFVANLPYSPRGDSRSGCLRYASVCAGKRSALRRLSDDPRHISLFSPKFRRPAKRLGWPFSSTSSMELVASANPACQASHSRCH